MIQDYYGKWLLTWTDIEIREGDIDIDVEDGQVVVTAYIETWFDVDLRLDTRTYGADHYVNLYCKYYPDTGDIKLIYFIHYANGDVSVEKEPEYFDESEQEMILRLMRRHGIDEQISMLMKSN